MPQQFFVKIVTHIQNLANIFAKIIIAIVVTFIPLSLHAGETVKDSKVLKKIPAVTDISPEEISQKADESNFTGELIVSWASKYVDAYSIPLSDVDSRQLSLTLFHRGWYASIWTSNGWRKNGSEVDFAAGYKSDPIKSLNDIVIAVGAEYWNFGEVSSAKGDCITPTITISKEFENVLWGTVEPSVRVEWALPVSGSPDGTANAFAVMFELKHSVELSAILKGLSLEHAIKVTFDDGPFGYKTGVIGSYTFGPAYEIDNIGSVYASIRFVGPIDKADDRESYTIWEIGIIRAF